jgi:hypothetical protein
MNEYYIKAIKASAIDIDGVDSVEIHTFGYPANEGYGLHVEAYGRKHAVIISNDLSEFGKILSDLHSFVNQSKQIKKLERLEEKLEVSGLYTKLLEMGWTPPN